MVLVHLVHNGAQALLRLPGSRCPRVEIGNVVAGLVAMYIATHQALGGDVLIVYVVLLGQVHLE